MTGIADFMAGLMKPKASTPALDDYDIGGPASDPNYQVPMDGYIKAPEPDEYLRQELGDQIFQQYQSMTPQQRMDFMNNPENGFVAPAPMDMRQLLQQDAKAAPIQGGSNLAGMLTQALSGYI